MNEMVQDGVSLCAEVLTQMQVPVRDEDSPRACNGQHNLRGDDHLSPTSTSVICNNPDCNMVLTQLLQSCVALTGAVFAAGARMRRVSQIDCAVLSLMLLRGVLSQHSDCAAA